MSNQAKSHKRLRFPCTIALYYPAVMALQQSCRLQKVHRCTFYRLFSLTFAGVRI